MFFNIEKHEIIILFYVHNFILVFSMNFCFSIFSLLCIFIYKWLPLLFWKIMINQSNFPLLKFNLWSKHFIAKSCIFYTFISVPSRNVIRIFCSLYTVMKSTRLAHKYSLNSVIVSCFLIRSINSPICVVRVGLIWPHRVGLKTPIPAELK